MVVHTKRSSFHLISIPTNCIRRSKTRATFDFSDFETDVLAFGSEFVQPKKSKDKSSLETDDDSDDDHSSSSSSSEDRPNDPRSGFVSSQVNAPDVDQLQHKTKILSEKLAQSHTRIHQLKARKDDQKSKIKQLQDIILAQNDEFEQAQTQWAEEQEQRVMMGGLQPNLTQPHAAAAQEQQQRVRQENMRQMLTGVMTEMENNASADDFQDSGRVVGALEITLRRLRFAWRKFYPLASDVATIEARYGLSVVSYFVFFQWMIFNFVLLGLIGLVFFIRHVLVHTSSGPLDATMVGLAPRVTLFSSYVPSEALEYTLTLVTMVTFVMTLTVRKWVAEDHKVKRETTDASSFNTKGTTNRLTLNVWDMYLTSAEAVVDAKRARAQHLIVARHEQDLAQRLLRRSTFQRYVLLGRRVLGIGLYLGIQLASWYVIILLTTQNQKFERLLVDVAPVVAPYASALVPLTVTVINSLLPMLVKEITRLEMWDHEGYAIKAMILRLFVAKVLNIAIQLVRYVVVVVRKRR